MEADLLVLAIKTINYTDFSEGELNYSSEMVGFFGRIVNGDNRGKHEPVLASNMFYKVFKMVGLLVCVDEDGVKEYRARLVALAERLFEIEREKCLVVANSGVNVLREV